MKWWAALGVSAVLAALATAFALPYWAEFQVRYQIAGPTLWDSVSILVGLTLGTILRVGLGREAPSRGRSLLTLGLIVLVGMLTFVPWSRDSVFRVLVLPFGALAIAAWGISGSRRSTPQ